ncbi:MAG: hypothetical protein L0212_07705 [Acidobacteria bacterium]|nr:hypothetical protein [Acidobacteriota bacterium]
MIELRTLGALELKDSHGQPILAILQQPKRLGLLAYLGVASPRRFHRRDTLLAMFWPELDAEHARAALRRALYFLRRALGEGVVVGRGDEEVGIADGSLWTDTGAFRQALDQGRQAEALELYQGDLLQGFFISGAPEFERWLDAERTHLHRRASEAALALLGEQQAAGELRAAAHWARRAFTLSPDDEAALRRLLDLLDRTGDRAGALRTYDDFARRLAQDYELEPAAETRSLIEAIRARPAVTSPPPALQPIEVSPHVIAVFPFSVRGGSEFAYLGEGMVDLLSTKPDGAGHYRTVDPRAAQMSGSSRRKSIASENRKRSNANMPATPSASGLTPHRACSGVRR